MDSIIPYFMFKSVPKCVFAYMVARPMRVIIVHVHQNFYCRVSELAGAKLMDNNPDIADLSDPNRAMKLGERFSSLYDDDWTDGYQMFTEKFKLSEENAIRLLLDILLVMFFKFYISLP